MTTIWPISRILLIEILDDRITDQFVSQLVWERLGYLKSSNDNEVWLATKETPSNWSLFFPESPQIIANRAASVHLTRSIPKEYKQSLKNYLNFDGYKINELFPRRTRRATAVNWLLAFFISNRGGKLPECGPMPELLMPPKNPLQGHPGDKPVE